MMSHDLAKLLLSKPNLPMATYANGHTYGSQSHRRSHGSLKAGIVKCFGEIDHLMIGDFSANSFSGNETLKEHFVTSEKKDETVATN